MRADILLLTYGGEDVLRRDMHAFIVKRDDAAYMGQALDLARKGLGRTAPNPPVGAVIVKNDRVIGTGYHPQAGQPHAEVYALQSCTEDPRGATLYVTLEPCCHFGKTPPCTDAVISSGIKRVVIGVSDPNPIVAGKGAMILREAGIMVDVGVCAEAAGELIHWYAHWMTHRRPYVLIKAAMTLDGRIAAASGDSQWISSDESRHLVHIWRNEVDALLVGIGTVLKDDPLLTCRIEGGRDPYRIVLDRDYLIPAQARCLSEKCLVITAADPETRPEILQRGARVHRLESLSQGEFSWTDILTCLGSIGWHAVMIEGGGGIYSSILKHGSVDKLALFLAPKLLGGGIPLIDWGAPERMDQAQPLHIDNVRMIGADVLLEASMEA